MPQYKVLLFDFDDTLVQTKKIKSAALKELGQTVFNKFITDEDLDRHWGLPYQEFMSRLFDIQPDEVMNYIDHYRKLSLKYPQQPYPDTRETLTALSQSYSLGIITATSTYALNYQLDEINLPQTLFSYLQTADDTNFHKPDPKVFDPALHYFAQQGLKHDVILYVGDSLRDFFAARDAGITFIGIAENTTPKDIFAQHGARTISKLSEILQVLKE